MKYYAYITRPEDYLNGDTSVSLILRTTNEHVLAGWIYVTSIDIVVEDHVNEGDLRAGAIEDLDDQIVRARDVYLKDLQDLESRRDQLLAIEHKSEQA